MDGFDIREGDEVVVIGFATGEYGMAHLVQVKKVADGRIGFLIAGSYWNTEDPKIERAQRDAELNRKLAESAAKFKKSLKESKEINDRMFKCFADLDKLQIGMSANEVRATICSGTPEPWKINKTKTATMEREQWVYEFPDNSYVGGYLYFEDGRLVTIQTH